MLSLFSKKTVLAASAYFCMIGCLADLVLLYVFGNQIPGYNQLTFTISSLGESANSISGAVTIWSVILGAIFIFFGFSFGRLYSGYGKHSRRASLLIIIYGLGEGVASGIFKADRINGALTSMAIVHNLLGGIGVIALMLVPLVVIKIFTRDANRMYFRFSAVVWVTGLIFILLFSFRMTYFENSFLNIYKGLWQRIFLIDYYIYFIILALVMLKKINKKVTTTGL